jgi:hypothetical protein
MTHTVNAIALEMAMICEESHKCAENKTERQMLPVFLWDSKRRLKGAGGKPVSSEQTELARVKMARDNLNNDGVLRKGTVNF